jgi:hypothetical protein
MQQYILNPVRNNFYDETIKVAGKYGMKDVAKLNSKVEADKTVCPF